MNHKHYQLLVIKEPSKIFMKMVDIFMEGYGHMINIITIDEYLKKH